MQTNSQYNNNISESKRKWKRKKQLKASNEMHLERSFKTKMEPFKTKLSMYMNDRECNGVERGSNGGRKAARKKPEQCRTKRAQWRENKSESENANRKHHIDSGLLTDVMHDLKSPN